MLVFAQRIRCARRHSRQQRRGCAVLKENLLGVGDIGEVFFAVGYGQVQLVFFIHTNQLAVISNQFFLGLFQLFRTLFVVGLVGKYGDHAQYREPPLFALSILFSTH